MVGLAKDTESGNSDPGIGSAPPLKPVGSVSVQHHISVQRSLNGRTLF